MINPRTAPYTVQRLTAVKQGLVRPAAKVNCKSPVFTAQRSSLVLSPTSEILDIEATSNPHQRMASHNMPLKPLKLLSLDKLHSVEKAKSTFRVCIPYVIGGAIIILCIYLYSKSQESPDRENEKLRWACLRFDTSLKWNISFIADCCAIILALNIQENKYCSLLVDIRFCSQA